MDKKTISRIEELAKIGVSKIRIGHDLGWTKHEFERLSVTDEFLVAYNKGASQGLIEISRVNFTAAKSGVIPAIHKYLEALEPEIWGNKLAIDTNRKTIVNLDIDLDQLREIDKIIEGGF